MEWFPDGKRVLRMNEGQGNGGTEVLAIRLDDEGKPLDKISGIAIPKSIRFMDLPGRRSHEYFPRLDPGGSWLVWCATQHGHEHDIADYEVYLWKLDSDRKNGPVRLTFHSGNDRWPDIFLGMPKTEKNGSTPSEPRVEERIDSGTPPLEAGPGDAVESSAAEESSTAKDTVSADTTSQQQVE